MIIVILNQSIKINFRESDLLRKLKIKPILVVGLLILSLFGIGTLNQRSASASSYAQLIQRVHSTAAARRGDHHPSISSNTRDLGGYRTSNGKDVVKNDLIFRSGNFAHLNYRGAKTLHRLGIREVIDLRYPSGKSGAMSQYPDPGESGTAQRSSLRLKYKDYPTYSYYEEQRTEPAKRREGEIYRYGWPFTTLKSARKSYYEVFSQLLRKHSGAIMINCTGGRDRTGLASALILSALGVSRYNISNDYLLSDYYNHKYPYGSQLRELNHFYNTVQANYGSMNNYLHRGIGLKTWQINKLRRMYLVRIRWIILG